MPFIYIQMMSMFALCVPWKSFDSSAMIVIYEGAVLMTWSTSIHIMSHILSRFVCSRPGPIASSIPIEWTSLLVLAYLHDMVAGTALIRLDLWTLHDVHLHMQQVEQQVICINFGCTILVAKIKHHAHNWLVCVKNHSKNWKMLV